MHPSSRTEKIKELQVIMSKHDNQNKKKHFGSFHDVSDGERENLSSKSDWISHYSLFRFFVSSIMSFFNFDSKLEMNSMLCMCDARVDSDPTINQYRRPSFAGKPLRTSTNPIFLSSINQHHHQSTDSLSKLFCVFLSRSHTDHNCFFIKK